MEYDTEDTQTQPEMERPNIIVELYFYKRTKE